MALVHTTPIEHRVGARTVLATPAITINNGEHTLILGDSGCGKTTLLSLLAGLQQPTKGEITIDGQNLAHLKNTALDAFRGHTIGMIFQQLHLIDALSAGQNVALAYRMAGVSINNTAIRTLFTDLGLQGMAHRKPHQLSHGQAQRVAIARALVNKPKLILADEPTSALDDTHAEQVIALLLKQAEAHGATLVIATHDQRLKQHFKQHIIRLEARS